jgi:hypothetical protein
LDARRKRTELASCHDVGGHPGQWNTGGGKGVNEGYRLVIAIQHCDVLN